MVQIRPERASDCAGVEAVVEAAFGRVDEARLVSVLREAFDSAFQVLELAPGCLARRAGRVHYDEAITRL